MKTRLNFKSTIEFIVSSENFFYDIKIKDRSVFHSFIMLDLDIFQKSQHKEIIHYDSILAMHRG